MRDPAHRVFGAGLLGGVGARSSMGARLLAEHDATFGAGGARTRGYPRYWAKVGQEVVLAAGKPGFVTCWGWSALSPGEARGVAEARLRAAVMPWMTLGAGLEFTWAKSGSQLNAGPDGPGGPWGAQGLEEQKKREGWLWNYTPDWAEGATKRIPRTGFKLKAGNPSMAVARPAVEPIVEEVAGHRGVVGVVTRNRYGARILNATNAMFVDIDGANKTELRAGLADWGLRHPEAAMRVYETQNGLRVLRTDRTFDATSRETRELMAGMGADPKYAEMCVAQDCFRARLTPKPWRCGVVDAPNAFDTSSVLQAAWVQAYERASREYGVCRYVGSLGPTVVAPEVAPVIVLHDREAIKGSVLA